MMTRNVEGKSCNYQACCKLSVAYTLLEAGIMNLWLSVIKTKVSSQSGSLYQKIHVGIHFLEFEALLDIQAGVRGGTQADFSF